MKKLLTVVLSLLICSMSFSQPSIGLNYNTGGAGLQLGYLSDVGIDLQAGYNVPLFKNDKPSLLYFNLGYNAQITDDGEGEGIVISPYVGIANYRVKDFTEYEKGGGIIQVNETKMMYKLELGYHKGQGRVFIEAGYCGNAYFGIGFRGFIF